MLAPFLRILREGWSVWSAASYLDHRILASSWTLLRLGGAVSFVSPAMQSHQLPPPAQMMQLVMGSWVSQCVGAAARLNLADHLATGPKTAAELAQLASADADAVYRLARALASLGVFSLAGDRFSLTPLGETLRSGVPGSMRNIAIAETDDAHWLTWGRFTDAIRQGRKMSTEVLKMEPWDYYAKHPADGEQFSRAMTDISGLAIEAVLSGYDFPNQGRVVDVGGAHGSLLAAVLKKYSTLQGALFDLPHVVAAAKPTLEKQGLSASIEIVGGDFFKAVPANGDVYLLKHILHDWNDERSVGILRSVRAAMKPGARLLVVEFSLPKDATPAPGHLMDLNMLVMLDGRERTTEQYGALFAQAGLRLSRFIPTHGPLGLFEAVAA